MLHAGDATSTHIRRNSDTDLQTMDKSDAVNTSGTSHNLSCFELQLNSSFRLQCSLSSLSSESDLSMAFERELGEPVDFDELPAFEIRAFSPHGRTPSPIDNDLSDVDMETPKQEQQPQEQQQSPCRLNNPDFVALHEINAQISPPSDSANNSIAGMSRSNSLETIFEGVFLQTPPREKRNSSAGSRTTPNCRSRANLLELVAINRLQCDKENQLPLCRSTSPRKCARKQLDEYT